MTDPNDYVDHLTKREYFAARAMQGILANPGTMSEAAAKNRPQNSFAIAATLQADHLIAELNRTEEKKS